MDYSYSLHQEAFDEFIHAISWYKERGQSGRFRESIKKGILAIRSNPLAWQNDEDDPRFRRYVIKKFPFKIVYIVKEEEKHIFVIAIAATRRNPGYWQERTS